MTHCCLSPTYRSGLTSTATSHHASHHHLSIPPPCPESHHHVLHPIHISYTPPVPPPPPHFHPIMRFCISPPSHPHPTTTCPRLAMSRAGLRGHAVRAGMGDNSSETSEPQSFFIPIPCKTNRVTATAHRRTNFTFPAQWPQHREQLWARSAD